jgi:hypothetical protein
MKLGLDTMAIEDLSTPNRALRNTTVETTTTTTRPVDANLSRDVADTTSQPGNGGYGRREVVTTTTQPSGAQYARAETVVAPRPATGEYARRDAVVQTIRPSNGEYARRITVFVAGIIQGLIGVRILLLLFDARAANGLVATVMNVSQVFVAPFDGILHTGALKASGSVLDLAAIVALLGWTLVEALVIAGIGIFRREAV